MKQNEFQALNNNEKLNEIYKSVERTRLYFKWTLIVTLILFFLPLLFMPFAIMRFLGAYNINGMLGF